MKFCFIVRIVNWRWHAGIEVLKKVGVHMRKRRTHQERGGKKPRITNVLFLLKKEGQGARLCHVLLSQVPQHEMNDLSMCQSYDVSSYKSHSNLVWCALLCYRCGSWVPKRVNNLFKATPSRTWSCRIVTRVCPTLKPMF